MLSDKTGTLTQNVMIFKRLHLGTVCFTPDTMDDVRRNVEQIGVVNAAGQLLQQHKQHQRTRSRDLMQQMQQRQQSVDGQPPNHHHPPTRNVTIRRNVDTRVVEAVKAIAICHNVTPVYEEALDTGTLPSAAPTIGDRRTSVKRGGNASLSVHRSGRRSITPVLKPRFTGVLGHGAILH